MTRCRCNNCPECRPRGRVLDDDTEPCAEEGCPNPAIDGEEYCVECYDPTPDCHKCGAQRPEQCHCGPYADNR